MMSLILIAVGVVLLIFTVYEYLGGETDTLYLFDWDWIWFDVNRIDHPCIFKAAIIAQGCAAVGLIVAGITEL